MKRGDIWTGSGGSDYAGKPRPAVIVQDDVFDPTASITICPLTTHLVDAPLIRLVVEPSERNGFEIHESHDDRQDHDGFEEDTRAPGRRLSDEDIVRINRAVVVFLGLAGPGAR